MGNDFRNNNVNCLTSAITLPIFTNFSRNPMTVSKLSGGAIDEIFSITVPVVSIPDGMDNFELSAAL
jgi:hypothetical protein